MLSAAINHARNQQISLDTLTGESVCALLCMDLANGFVGPMRIKVDITDDAKIISGYAGPFFDQPWWPVDFTLRVPVGPEHLSCQVGTIELSGLAFKGLEAGRQKTLPVESHTVEVPWDKADKLFESLSAHGLTRFQAL